MTRRASDPAAVKRAAEGFRSENAALARIALDQPEKYPHLQEWARKILSTKGESE